jgi:hypothetical protein
MQESSLWPSLLMKARRAEMISKSFSIGNYGFLGGGFQFQCIDSMLRHSIFRSQRGDLSSSRTAANFLTNPLRVTGTILQPVHEFASSL